jgi:hypothetical protein
MPAAAASGVSAATTATGAPAQAGSAVSGLSPFIVNGPSGPITARTPGVMRAASTSIVVTRHRATGARRTCACSIPASWTSTV